MPRNRAASPGSTFESISRLREPPMREVTLAFAERHNRYANRATARNRAQLDLLTYLRSERRLPIQIADKLRQVGVPKHLANGQILARVIPVVVDHSEH